jgi:two-component system sensor histidine kinase AgrC
MLYFFSCLMNIITLEWNIHLFFHGLFNNKNKFVLFVTNLLVCSLFFVISIYQYSTFLIFQHQYLMISALVIYGYYLILGRKRANFGTILLFFLAENIFILFLLNMIGVSLSKISLIAFLPVLNLLFQVILSKVLRKKYQNLVSPLFHDKRKKRLVIFLLAVTLLLQINLMSPKQSRNQNIITSETQSGEMIEQIDQKRVFQINQIFFVFVIFVLIMVIYVNNEVRKKRKNKQMINDKKMMEEYIDTLERMQLDIQKVQHDYKNILIGINGFLDDENVNVPELKAFLQRNKLIQNKVQIKTGTLNQLKRINIPIIKGLTSTKIIQAIQAGINVSIECREEIDIKKIDSFDLSRALGIILDNAIEECEKHPDAIIRVAFIDDDEKTTIIVENTCEQEALTIVENKHIRVSTKGKNRGFGLINLSEIINKHHNLYLETSCEDYIFTQTLIIKK